MHRWLQKLRRIGIHSKTKIDLTLSCELLFAVSAHYLRDSSLLCCRVNPQKGTMLSACPGESVFVFQLHCFFLS